LPDLATLRLAPPLDMAWVNPHYGIWGCGVSPDGRYVVSASRGGDDSGGYLLLWDADAGTRIASVFHSHELRDCAVSPDGRHLISQDGAGTVAVRALPALTLEGTIEQPLALEHRPTRGSTRGSQRRWRRFAVSADGGRIAVAGFGTVRIFTLAPFAFDGSVDDLGTLSQGIVGLGFDADRLIIVGRGEPMPVLVWDVNLRRIVERSELQVPDIDGISRAVVAADKRLLIAAGDDATVVWTLDQSAPVGMIPGGIPGQALAVSADATMAATSGPERYDPERAISLVGQTIRLWSLPDLRRIASWTLAHLGCRDIVTGLAFSADNRHLVLAGWEGVVRRLAIG
jgi:WD40 repeat protein